MSIRTIPRRRAALPALLGALPWALLAVVAVPASASADEATASMQQAMETYFLGERHGGYGFAAVGVASLAAGGVLVASDSDLARGMSYPLLAGGAIQLAVGGVVIHTSGPRIRKFNRMIAENPGTYLEDEYPRASAIDTQIKILLITETVLVVGGVATAIVASSQDRDTLAGMGAGIAIQAATLMVSDVFVGRRARAYTRALASFQAIIEPAKQSYRLSWSTRF